MQDQNSKIKLKMNFNVKLERLQKKVKVKQVEMSRTQLKGSTCKSSGGLSFTSVSEILWVKIVGHTCFQQFSFKIGQEGEITIHPVSCANIHFICISFHFSLYFVCFKYQLHSLNFNFIS